MKILYHHRIASKDGQYVHIEELTRALKAAGHELIIVGPKVVDADEFGGEGGMVAVLKRHVPKALYELMELGYSLLAYWRLSRAAKQHRPDVLYERYNLFLPAGIWLAKRKRMPMLLEVNAPLFDERLRYDGLALKRLARWSERYCWRRADGVLPVTEVLADRVRQEGVDSAKIHVIPNGIDWEKFCHLPDVDKAKETLGLAGQVVLGFAGFVREWHGLERVVDAVAADPRRHLLVVGDGPARAAIESRAQAMGVTDQVMVTGIVARDRIADYVAAFDIALQPDVVAYASPLKLFEYLAMGRAIIAPDRPNIREVLEHGENAWLFDPDAPRGLVDAIERLCQDTELRQRLGAGARGSIDKQGLTWAANAKRVEQLYLALGVKKNQSVTASSSSSQEAK
ncbi:MAG TPA: glycosyltransferase family 1 protein [Gammaproteobacteria bacterium]|nr:glycosyltransferase family 1 protein [Gammaproteobacteria bacterium]